MHPLQLLDPASGTCTYLLHDPQTREALIIDPVDAQIERDLAVLQARLVHEAQRDLVYTNTSIKRLASNLGFEDEGYFGRFFRKHTGLTPREFRARALGSFNSAADGSTEVPGA